MTPDLLEERLRAALHDATSSQEEAFLDLDAAEVLGRGHRVVRRRRVAAGAGIAAATAVIGLVGWSALGGGAERATTPPAGTPSARPATGPVTAVLDAFSDLSDPSTGERLEIPGPVQVAVTLDAAGDPDLVVSQVRADGVLEPVVEGTDVTGGSDVAAWTTLGEGSHVIAGVLPPGAQGFQLVTPLDDAGGHPTTTVTGPLPGTGRTAFAVRFGEAADPGLVRHLVWQGADGTVHDELGAVIPSVVLGDADRTTLFVAQSLDRMGTFTSGGASMTALDGSRNSSGRPVLASAHGTGAALEGLFAAVVPDGTTSGTMLPTAGTITTRALAVADLPGSDLSILWATYTTPQRASGAPYASVTWTEPGGRTVTERP